MSLRSLHAEDAVWLRGALSDANCNTLCELTALDGRPGSRIANASTIIDKIATSQFLKSIHADFPNAHPVRLVAFSKSINANWGVSWHQDRVIAVADRHNVEGFTKWSCKSGQWHCEPPLKTLEQMFFARLHLDDCDATNGAMEIALGSHKLGRVDAGEASKAAASLPVECATARRGDVLLLPMLTLHRSKHSSSQNLRRALRIDFACVDLPKPLRWSK